MLLSRSRLEPDPWRLVWSCRECDQSSSVRVNDQAHRWLVEFLRPGGLVIGAFEADEFEFVSPELLSEAAAAELW